MKIIATASSALIALLAAPPLTAEEGEAAAEPSAAQRDPDPFPVAEPREGVDPQSLKIAGRIVELGYPPELREELFFATMDQTVMQMRSAIAPSLPADQPGAVRILDEWIEEYVAESKELLRSHIPSIMDGMTHAYATIFTREELGDILAFVETPSGRRYFEMSPAIVAHPRFAEANQRYMDESMERLGPARDELLGRLQQHLSDQSEDDTSPDT